MRPQVKNLKYIFDPKSIVVVGASTNTSKIGNVVLKNLLDGKFKGKIYPVNPKYKKIMNLICYSSVLKIKEKIDCAIIAIPAPYIPQVLKECAKKGIKGVVVLSGGFGEAGRADLEEELVKIANKHSIALIGPNCVGVMDPYSGVDSVFLPMHKLQRPDPGQISIITQSGAVGSSIVDLAAHYEIGFSKFVSYGNAAVIDESDLLEFLSKDKKTKQILLYIEGVKDGKKLLQISKKVNSKKPIVVLKAGRHEKSAKAASSHTGNIAGNYLAYLSAFRQAKLTVADSLEDFFHFIKIFNQPLPKTGKIGIITNGGGFGVLSTDAIEDLNLELAELKNSTIKELKKIIPDYATAANPLDIIADAEPTLYEKTIQVFMDETEVGALIIIVLFQTPAVDERLVDIIVRFSDLRKKPIAVVAVGGEYTDTYRQILDSYNVPTYSSPLDAVKSLKQLIDYSKKK